MSEAIDALRSAEAMPGIGSPLVGELIRVDGLHVDRWTADALGNRYHLAEREVLLKGFPSPIRAHEVVGLAAP